LISPEGVLKAVLQYAGFFLALLLFSEEFRRLVRWFRNIVRQYPRLRFLVYPLATLLVIAAAALIVNSLIHLCSTVLFTYD
jgi:hypothetical protein